MKPTIRSGKLVTGADCELGQNVVVDVAEEVTLGDRCVIGDGTVFSGRRVEIGNDFYGYSWSHPTAPRSGIAPVIPAMRGWLDVGMGRKDDEDAILKVGARCTFHDNRIDLARAVTIGDDVGLSPGVVIYTHGYWMSHLDGYPMSYGPVTIGDRSIIYTGSLVSPGCIIGPDVVVGPLSVCAGSLAQKSFWSGNPAKQINGFFCPPEKEREARFYTMMQDYQRTLAYRGIDLVLKTEFPSVWFSECLIDADTQRLAGDEDQYSDDLRDFLFKRGIRVYTKRRFKKLPKR